MATPTPDRVKQLWISSTPLPDDDLITNWLQLATRTIHAEIPNLAARIHTEQTTGGETLAALAADTAVAMVIRCLKNPDSLRSRQSSNGPFGGSVMYGGETPGELQLTERERRRLLQSGQRSGEIDLLQKRRYTDD